MEKKELLREKAIEVFAREGYHSTTVQMIADEAGTAVGTVYNYFDNKKDILNYIFAVEFNKRLNMLNQIKEMELTFKEKLIMFLKGHFNDLKNNINLATVLIQESTMPSKYQLEAVNDFTNKLPELFIEIIEEAKQKGEIRNVDSKLIGHAVFRTIRGIASVVIKDANYNFSDARQELINFFWIGLNKR